MSDTPEPTPILNNEDPQSNAGKTSAGKPRKTSRKKMAQLEPKPNEKDADAILEEMRHALMEEEEKKQSGFIERTKQKLKKSSSTKRKKKEEPKEPAPTIEKFPPATASADKEPSPTLLEITQEPETETILAMLAQAEAEEKPAGVEETPTMVEPVGVRVEAEPERVEPARSAAQPSGAESVTPAGPSKQAIKLRGDESKSVDNAELRHMALEDYVEPPKEKVRVQQESILDKIGDFSVDRRKFAIFRFVSLAALTLVTALSLIVILMVVRRPAASEVIVTPSVVAPTLPPPFPVQVRLPGGWGFLLNKGSIQDNKWSPQSAEWLVGTEICKWIALPWTEQLEAVFETLEPGDEIILVMSNADRWLYKVKSYQTIEISQASKLDQSTPSLLLFLIKAGSSTRQVIVAVP